MRCESALSDFSNRSFNHNSFIDEIEVDAEIQEIKRVSYHEHEKDVQYGKKKCSFIPRSLN